MDKTTNNTIFYPFRLRPVIKDKIWGGNNLAKVLGKQLPGQKSIGETWEVWEGCVIENGEYAGQTLAQVAERDPAAVLGTAMGAGRFPLLFKFIDAQDDLSVQVHPDDQEARSMEDYPYGKTEAWYILHAEPDARLILGFNRDVTSAEIAASIRDNSIVHLMSSVPVQRGDVLFVPAGTVHAIGRGIVLAEIQENSDITYRLYDWGREAAGRELHVDQSLKVLDRERLDHPKIPTLEIRHRGYEQCFLVACRYFALELLRVRESISGLKVNGRFQILSCIQGAASVHYGDQDALSVQVEQGQTLLLPAQLGIYGILPRGDGCALLRAYVPDLIRDVIAPLRQAGRTDLEIAKLGGPASQHNDLLSFLS